MAGSSSPGSGPTAYRTANRPRHSWRSRKVFAARVPVTMVPDARPAVPLEVEAGCTAGRLRRMRRRRRQDQHQCGKQHRRGAPNLARQEPRKTEKGSVGRLSLITAHRDSHPSTCLREAGAPAFAKPASAGEGRSLRRRQASLRHEVYHRGKEARRRERHARVSRAFPFLCASPASVVKLRRSGISSSPQYPHDPP